MNKYDQECVVERVGRRAGIAEPVALTVPEPSDYGPRWSIFILRDGRPADPVRQGLMSRGANGLFYIQGCDSYGFPETGLIRPKMAHGEGSPAFESFLDAIGEFLGRTPSTRLRYARG
jgi:hypothetical protein